MHRDARRGKQRKCRLIEIACLCKQRLSSARHVGVAYRHLRAAQHGERLAQTKPIAKSLELVASLLGKCRRSLNLARPKTQVCQQRHHDALGPFVAALASLGSYLGGERFGFGKPAVIEVNERKHPICPTEAGAIAELGHRNDRVVDAFLGKVDVAAKERHEAAVLLDVAEPAPIAKGRIQALGLAEQPLGIGKRTAEQLKESAGAQRVGQLLRVVEQAEDRDRFAQLPACRR